MKQSTKKIALAASAFAFAALFSFSWSEQSGIALSIESAEARVGRPLTPVSVAGVARRQYRRAAIGTAAAGRRRCRLLWRCRILRGQSLLQRYGSGSPRSLRGWLRRKRSRISTRPHYAVSAYYAGGPWYGYSGWDDYRPQRDQLHARHHGQAR